VSAYQEAIEAPANSVVYAVQQDDQTDERIVMGDGKVWFYNSDLLHLRKTYNIPTEDTQNPKLHYTEGFIYSN
jgi:hypothetical protein